MKYTNSTSTKSLVKDLVSFLDSSVCNFWAVETVKYQLNEAGFKEINLGDKWDITPGGRYFVIKNSSAIFAFIAGKNPESAFHIISAHSDSPGFRLKPKPEMICDGNIVKLNTEVYGGPILYTWFDRPLSLAGRVILRGETTLTPITRLVKFSNPLLTIPHLAIHFNRTVNEGNKISRQKDMLPILGYINDVAEKDGLILRMVAEKLNVQPEEILDFDLMLYDVTKAMLVGLNEEFITSGRIDDLQMVHAAMTALLSCEDDNDSTRVMAIFDNEETGSGTKQGAASPILFNILSRINKCLGGDEETMLRSIAHSFMISADNAHGVHPNYIEKHDPTNHPVLGKGPVIKINANCKYMTDAESAAIFASICKEANVPVQYFVNHSDSAGGSTLGNILTSQIDLRGVDMGAAQWAMHSVRETAATVDHHYIVKAFTHFYNL